MELGSRDNTHTEEIEVLWQSHPILLDEGGQLLAWPKGEWAGPHPKFAPCKRIGQLGRFGSPGKFHLHLPLSFSQTRNLPQFTTIDL